MCGGVLLEQENEPKGAGRESFTGISLIVAALIISGSILYTGNLINNSVGEGFKGINTAGSAALKSEPPPSKGIKDSDALAPPSVEPGTGDGLLLKTMDLADDDAIKGADSAEVLIIEFSDFECPFCGRFYSETLPSIQSDYIDTGKVQMVYRDFPLGFHAQAKPAAIAAECAGEQGKFWEFHDKIFENQGSLGDASYKQWAEGLGLNTEQFNSCVDSEKYSGEVDKDFSDGAALGVSGTPTFFIGKRNSAPVKLVGAQPFDAFKAVINPLLGG